MDDNHSSFLKNNLWVPILLSLFTFVIAMWWWQYLATGCFQMKKISYGQELCGHEASTLLTLATGIIGLGDFYVAYQFYKYFKGKNA